MRPASLDAKLRKALQVELKALQEAVGITFVYVTHDQEEALTMSDRLAVMAGGRIEQVGSPTELYEEPATTYVAGFLGVANLLAAKAGGHDGAAAAGCAWATSSWRRPAATPPPPVTSAWSSARAGPAGALRHHRPQPCPRHGRTPRLPGPATQLAVRLANGEPLQALVQNQGEPLSWEQGTAIAVHLPVDALRVLRESA